MGTLREQGEPAVYLTFPGLASLGVPHATTTRGTPGVAAWSDPGGPFRPEVQAALRPAGLDVGRAAWARQVHGADAVRVAGPGFAGQADALITTQPGLALAVFTADCLGVLLCDLQGGVLAAAHAGWRGTAGGMVAAAVGALTGAGGRPERVRAAISPSIGPCCYEVDEPVIAAFRRGHPGRWERWVRPARAGHWMLDLWQAGEDLLAAAGVPPAQIDNARLCTACHPDLFYSYRRGNHGRLVTLAALPG
jgi:YfiH family protein